MIVYSATKQAFVADARSNQVHAKVIDEARRRLNLRAGPSEVAAWRNSLQFMSNVLNDDDIPGDSKVSIEYQLPLSSKRIDFILTGKNAKRQDSAVIIELKQWSDVVATDKDAIVRTYLGRGEKETAHPSYQAWSYAAMLDDFNETVRNEDIQLVRRLLLDFWTACLTKVLPLSLRIAPGWGS